MNHLPTPSGITPEATDQACREEVVHPPLVGGVSPGAADLRRREREHGRLAASLRRVEATVLRREREIERLRTALEVAQKRIADVDCGRQELRQVLKTERLVELEREKQKSSGLVAQLETVRGERMEAEAARKASVAQLLQRERQLHELESEASRLRAALAESDALLRELELEKELACEERDVAQAKAQAREAENRAVREALVSERETRARREEEFERLETALEIERRLYGERVQEMSRWLERWCAAALEKAALVEGGAPTTAVAESAKSGQAKTKHSKHRPWSRRALRAQLKQREQVCEALHSALRDARHELVRRADEGVVLETIRASQKEIARSRKQEIRHLQQELRACERAVTLRETEQVALRKLANRLLQWILQQTPAAEQLQEISTQMLEPCWQAEIGQPRAEAGENSLSAATSVAALPVGPAPSTESALDEVRSLASSAAPSAARVSDDEWLLVGERVSPEPVVQDEAERENVGESSAEGGAVPVFTAAPMEVTAAAQPSPSVDLARVSDQAVTAAANLREFATHPAEQGGPEPRPAIFDYWRDRQLKEKLQLAGVDSVLHFYAQFLSEACRVAAGKNVCVLSLGGECWDLEIRLVEWLRARDQHNVQFDCVDVCDAWRARKRAEVVARGLSDVIKIAEHAPEHFQIAEGRYAVCLADRALQRLSDPSRVLENLRRGLAAGGVLLLSDVLARGGDARTAEERAVIEQIWKLMPERYKYNHLRGCRETGLPEPLPPAAGGEGSFDLLAALPQQFSFEVFLPGGNLIEFFATCAFGPNFDPEQERDRRFIDQVARLDDARIDAGLLKPRFFVAALRRESKQPARFYKHWTPEFCAEQPLHAEG